MPPVATPPPGQGHRLSQPEQQQLITQTQQRVTTYQDYMQRQHPVAERQIEQLRRHHRHSQYRFHQRYLQLLLAQQLAFRNRHYDYFNDPFFYTAPNYRYFRGGRYYEINNYAADLLHEAVNRGYEEGYYAGRADREDHWPFDYRNCYAYQDASYGYDGLYVDSEEYRYYFQQGFERGYRDGYYGRFRYGSYHDGRYSILGPILATILVLEAIH